ncbi:MAG: hypothetical protein M1140_09995, partial [Chloroflexi bacterium]|nr:hypothetical protein [Chloroflexota bacterium]
MANPTQREPIRWERQFPIFVNYFIVSLMMVCLVATLGGVLAAVMPGWDGAYLSVVSFAVALEALYSTRITRRLSVFSREWIGYRASELVSILILLKLLIYAMRGFDQLARDLPLWEKDFLTTFFTGEYLLACLVVFGVYLLCAQFSGNLIDLEADDDLLERERQNEFRNDRAAFHRQLTLKVVLVAAVMIVVTVLTHGYLRLSVSESAAAQVNAANLMIYVFLGFVLLSLTRYSAMRAAWFRERATINPGIAWRWAAYSIGFLAIVALVVSLLPTRYTVGLLQTLQYALGALITALQIIVYVLMVILTFPLSLLMRLLGQGPVSPGAPPTAPLMPKTPNQDLPPTANPLLDFIQSLLFWAIFLIVVGYALKQYFSRHRALLDALRSIPLLGWLAQGLGQLWQLLRRVSGRIAVAVDAGIRRLRASAERSAPTPARPPRLSLRRMTPRQRVQFFYLAMVRRGEQRGMRRKPAQ